jgi:hypothetical protein
MSDSQFEDEVIAILKDIGAKSAREGAEMFAGTKFTDAQWAEVAAKWELLWRQSEGHA